MTQKGFAIRFVGGPWHNRIVDICRLDSDCRVLDETIEATSRNPFPVSNYRLFRFYTGWRDEDGRNTIFSQYVHESVPTDRNGLPIEQNIEYVALPVDIELIFDQAFRGCFYVLKGRHVDDCDDWPWPSRLAAR